MQLKALREIALPDMLRRRNHLALQAPGDWMRTATNRVITVAFFCLVALVPITPLLQLEGWPDSHEHARYLFLKDHFREAFLHGIWYPRWLPDAYAGYGYPTFVFYQPAVFFGELPFTFLPGYPLQTARLYLFCLSLVGTVGAYFLARHAVRLAVDGADEQLAGVFGALLFVLTPYIYVNLYVRGALAEYAAMMLVPWALFTMLLLKDRVAAGRGVSGALAGLAILLAAITLAHPLISVALHLVLGALVVGLAVRSSGGSLYFLLLAGAAVIAGACLSSPYWWPVLELQQYVSLNAAQVSAELHVVEPWQFFSREWGFGFSNAPEIADGMSFQLGLFHALLAAVGWIASRRSREFNVVGVVYAVLIVGMSSLSAWVWREAEVIQWIQFPWRLLTITASLQVFLAIGIFRLFPATGVSRPALAALLLVLGATVLWQQPQFVAREGVDAVQALQEHRATGLSAFNHFSSTDEFRPRSAGTDLQLIRSQGEGLVSLIPGGELLGASASPAPGSDQFRIRYSVSSPASTRVIINQFYFPGWRVEIDGKGVPTRALEQGTLADGRMTIEVPSGTSAVEAWYAGPPGAGKRMTLVIAAVVFLVTAPYWERRTRRWVGALEQSRWVRRAFGPPDQSAKT